MTHSESEVIWEGFNNLIDQCAFASARGTTNNQRTEIAVLKHEEALIKKMILFSGSCIIPLALVVLPESNPHHS